MKKLISIALFLMLCAGMLAIVALAEEGEYTVELEVIYPEEYAGTKCGGITVYDPVEGTREDYIGDYEIKIPQGQTLYYRALDTVGDLLPVMGTGSFGDVVPREEWNGEFYNALREEDGVETVIVEYVSESTLRRGIETDMDYRDAGEYVIELTVSYPAAEFDGRSYGVENAYTVEKTGGIRQMENGEAVAEYVGEGERIVTEGTFAFLPIEVEGMNWSVYYRSPSGGGNWATAGPPELGVLEAPDSPLEVSGPGVSILLSYSLEE